MFTFRLETTLSFVGHDARPDVRRAFRRLTERGIPATRIHHVVICLTAIDDTQDAVEAAAELHDCFVGIAEVTSTDVVIRSELFRSPQALPHVQ